MLLFSLLSAAGELPGVNTAAMFSNEREERRNVPMYFFCGRFLMDLSSRENATWVRPGGNDGLTVPKMINSNFRKRCFL